MGLHRTGRIQLSYAGALPRRGPPRDCRARPRTAEQRYTLAGAYFAFRSQPATFGTADWVKQANAACEQDFGELRLSAFDGLVPVQSSAGQNTSSTQQLASKVQDWITEEGDLSKQVGDLSAIQTPHDARVGQVRAVLNSGNALVGSMNTVSDDMQAYVQGTNGISATQAALDPADLTNCVGRPALEGGGVLAAINCQTVSPGPTLRPLVVQFSDITAADAWFNTSTTGFVDNKDCVAGSKLGGWTHNGLRPAHWAVPTSRGTTSGWSGLSTTP